VNINYKVIPHIDGRTAIRQLTSRKLADVNVHECWAGPCTVELRPNAQAPVHKLPVREMGDGYFWCADFTLVAGTIIHDYLK
jgi:acetoacetate decarboxylase